MVDGSSNGFGHCLHRQEVFQDVGMLDMFSKGLDGLVFLDKGFSTVRITGLKDWFSKDRLSQDLDGHFIGQDAGSG